MAHLAQALTHKGPTAYSVLIHEGSTTSSALIHESPTAI